MFIKSSFFCVKEHPFETIDTVYMVFSLIFAFAYYILMIFAIIQLLVVLLEYALHIYDERGFWDGTLMFRIVFFVGSIVCCLMSGMYYTIITGFCELRNQTPLAVIMGSFPGYLYISMSLLLVFFWMYIVHAEHTMKTNNIIVKKVFSMLGLLILYFLAMLVMYAILVCAYVFLITGYAFFNKYWVEAHFVEAAYAALLCFIVIAAAIVYGTLMVRLVIRLRKEVHLSTWKHIIKYGGVSIVAAVMLSTRLVIIIIELLPLNQILQLLLRIVSESFTKFIPMIMLGILFGRWTYKIRGKTIQVTRPQESTKEEWNVYSAYEDEYEEANGYEYGGDGLQV